MPRRLPWLLAALLVLGLAAWALRPRPIEVDVATVGPQDIEIAVEEEGRSRIREVFTVSAPIAGRMERLDLHAGDSVAAGETVVARLSPAAPALLDARARRVAEAARDAAVAAVELARAELSRSEAQAAFAAAELDRTGALFDRGTVPARALDAARLDEAAARAAVESARANLLVAERQEESAAAALIEGDAPGGGCCVEVLAPATGRILRVLTESEQVVAAGTPILEIGDPADLEVVVELLSSDAVRVAEGAPAAIDGWGGPPLPATVRRMDPSATTRVSALGIEEQRVTAILALGGAPADRAGLGDGYRVSARILLARHEGVPAVPVGALFRNGDDWAVFRMEEGIARLVPIEVGARDADWAEVRAGLAPGDAVLLHPGDRVADGLRVRPRGG